MELICLVVDLKPKWTGENVPDRKNKIKHSPSVFQLQQLVKETCDDIETEIKKKLVPSNKHQTLDEELECYRTIFDAFQIKCFTINQVSRSRYPRLSVICFTVVVSKFAQTSIFMAFVMVAVAVVDT